MAYLAGEDWIEVGSCNRRKCQSISKEFACKNRNISRISLRNAKSIVSEPWHAMSAALKGGRVDLVLIPGALVAFQRLSQPNTE
jgi:hypothetical protein